MSATNVTTYYEFPVFVGSDKPAWLVDWNGAMNAIDSAIHEAKAEADANATNIASLQSDVTSLSGSVSSQGSSITSLTQSLTSLQGTVNTITSLIGNGLPTTDDKTIIGAINELKADIDAIAPSGDVEAEDITYDNTTSGLTATNVQSAIDEINAKDAEDIAYDNTTSGLTATDVQSAIDELAQGGTDLPDLTAEHAVGKIGADTVYEKVYTASGSHNTTFVVDASAKDYNVLSINSNYGAGGAKYPPLDDGTNKCQGIWDPTNGLRMYLAGAATLDWYSITLIYTK